MSLRIVQLSDIHIGHPGEMAYNADPREQFLAVLESARAHRPDLIVLTGDLCLKEGDAQTYAWIRDQLTRFDTPTYCIAGNHDDSQMLAQVFHPDWLVNGELYFRQDFSFATCLFLDSAPARLSESQWTWLANQLAEIKWGPIFIFIHHPPMPCGVRYMDDRYPFQESGRFLALVHKTKNPVYVFCGHYHNARNLISQNLFLHICPSTLFQLHPEKEEFELLHNRPGYRMLDVFDQEIRTWVHWI